MQCPRCYYTNAAGTAVCEYCGARLAADGPVQSGGSASSKRKTVLGPVPSHSPPPPMPSRASRIDPQDPFRIAAEGIPAPPAPAPDPVEPPPLPAVEPPRARPQRATVITGPAETALAPLFGVAIVIGADSTAGSVLLREGRVRIGRRTDLEIVIDDPTASAEHALLRLQGEEAWLLDTSSNGTRVGETLCLNDRVAVADGTVLQIGATSIVIKLLSSDTLMRLNASEP